MPSAAPASSTPKSSPPPPRRRRLRAASARRIPADPCLVMPDDAGRRAPLSRLEAQDACPFPRNSVRSLFPASPTQRSPDFPGVGDDAHVFGQSVPGHSLCFRFFLRFFRCRTQSGRRNHDQRTEKNARRRRNAAPRLRKGSSALLARKLPFHRPYRPSGALRNQKHGISPAHRLVRRVGGVAFGAIQSPWPSPAIWWAATSFARAHRRHRRPALFPDTLWLAACLAVSTAIAVMLMTGTLHPPGGATALIAVTGGEGIRQLGYWYALVPCLAGACIMLFIALIVNNIPIRAAIPSTGGDAPSFRQPRGGRYDNGITPRLRIQNCFLFARPCGRRLCGHIRPQRRLCIGIYPYHAFRS